MQITISGDTNSELLKKLEQAADLFGMKLVAQEGIAPIAEPASTPPLPAKAQKAAKPAPAAEVKAAEPKKVTAAEAVAVEPKASATKEEAGDAAKALNAGKGIDALKAVLLKFGAGKMSELQEKDYAAFVAACKSA